MELYKKRPAFVGKEDAMLRNSADFKIPDAVTAKENEKFYVNPIGSEESPDPYVVYDKKYRYYYLLFTRGKEVRIYRSRTLGELRNNENSKQVYSVSQGDGITGCIWAPEMHFFDGRWYIYTSGARTPDGREDRTLFILRSLSDDPFDGFEFAGFPDSAMNAIDPTVYRHSDGNIYMCYSAEKNGLRIHIRRMKDPISFAEPCGRLICEAEYDWEKVPPYVGNSTIVEGSFFVTSPDKKRLFIIYSANGCWSDYYSLGVLECVGKDILDPKSWAKAERPVFVKGNGTYGPGHASFFTAPNGNLYIAYHSMHESNVKVSWAPRYLHVQRVYFDETGYPAIGEPLPMGVKYPEPEGEA